MAGLPPHAQAAARASAEAKGLAGWRFTLHAPSAEPFTTYLDDGELRREMWTAAVAVGASGAQDNAALITRILALRAEKAALLGKAHFADLVLERRMAKTGARALAFVEDFQQRAAPARRANLRSSRRARRAAPGRGSRHGKSRTGRKNSARRATRLMRKCCGRISRWIA